MRVGHRNEIRTWIPQDLGAAAAPCKRVSAGSRQTAQRAQTAELEAKNLEPKNKNTHIPAHFDFNQDLCLTSAEKESFEKVVIFELNADC